MDMQPAEYTVRTANGKFHMKITAAVDRTKKAESFMINIGSKKRQCIQLTVPLKHTGHTDAKLVWVEAHEECSLERYIKEGIAQHMVLLGITMARHINSSIKTIFLDDTNSFMCALPNGKEQKVPMKPFHIAFHEATWYEYYFDAKLKNNHEEYVRLKKNMYRSEYKPLQFDFINQELQTELQPLYDASLSWYDFFQAIATKYEKKKCTVIYPWIVQAMNHIFEGSIFNNTSWYIDLEANKAKNKTKMIPSEIIKYDPAAVNYRAVKGGKRGTLKHRRARRYTASRIDIFPSIPQIQSWNWRSFLHKNAGS
jgi:hypothetical protein